MNAAAQMPEASSPHVMPTYGRLPIALSHGQGCRVWDVNGKEYLDALGGIAVNTLGHNHPKLVPALQDQLTRLIHTSNYYHIPHQEALAKKLVDISGLSNVFFCSTGLEANEAALKLARKFGHDKGIERPEIVVYEKAFHGRSIATLSATGNAKVQAGFGPLVEGFIRVPLNDIAEPGSGHRRQSEPGGSVYGGDSRRRRCQPHAHGLPAPSAHPVRSARLAADD